MHQEVFPFFIDKIDNNANNQKEAGRNDCVGIKVKRKDDTADHSKDGSVGV
jgi:hypothetical protein